MRLYSRGADECRSSSGDRTDPALSPRRLPSFSEYPGVDRGRLNGRPDRGWSIRAPFRRAGMIAASDQLDQPHAISTHSELLWRSGDIRPHGPLSPDGRLPRPSASRGLGLQPAAETNRTNRIDRDTNLHLRAAVPRPRTVADVSFHCMDLALPHIGARHGTLRLAVARPGGSASWQCMASGMTPMAPRRFGIRSAKFVPQ